MIYVLIIVVVLALLICCAFVFLQEYGTQLKNKQDKQLKDWRD
jgi:hypothetical protein